MTSDNLIVDRAAQPANGHALSVLDVIRDRRSAGRFAPTPPDRQIVEQVVEAACWAPNHHLTEPWRFVVLAGDARAQLGEAVAAEIITGATAGEKSEAVAAGVRTKVQRSPVIIVVAQTGASDDPERNTEDYAACCCATQNLMLAAHAAGLATKWSTGAMVASAAAKRYLGLNPADRIVAYIYLGYAAEPAPASKRRPSAEVARWLGWGGS